MRITQHQEGLALPGAVQASNSRSGGQATGTTFASLVATTPPPPSATSATSTQTFINPLAGWVTCNNLAATTAATAAQTTEVAPVINTGTQASTATSTTTAGSTATETVQPGIGALITAIMNGSFKPTYESQSQLVESTPLGNIADSSAYYASDQTAQQLATLLGGTVVQKVPFGSSNAATTEIKANFIQLPSGQTVNAADLSYYAQFGAYGAQQLAADLTQEINQGGQITDYNNQMVAFMNGQGPHPGDMPTFQPGVIGPAIAGMSYPPGTLAADGSVINPMASNIAT